MARACCESTVVERAVRDAVGQRADDARVVQRCRGGRAERSPLFARPSSRQGRLLEDRKIAGSTKGRRILALVMAGCRRSRLARRLALRLARIAGCRTVVDRPSVVQVQLCASPVRTPGRLLISTRNRPAGDSTRASTSLTLPSSSMNSKLVQTCHGIAVWQVAAQPVQRLALPGEVGLGDDMPTGGAEGHACPCGIRHDVSNRSPTWHLKSRQSRSMAGRSTRVAVSL